MKATDPTVSLLRPIPPQGNVEQCNNHLQKGWETAIYLAENGVSWTVWDSRPLRILSPRHIEIIKGVIWQNLVLTFLHLVEAFQKLHVNERSQNRLDETGTFEVINDFYLLTYSIQ